MNTRCLPLSRVGATAVVSLLVLTGCAPGTTIGVTPGTILSTVLASLPAGTVPVSVPVSLPTGGGSSTRTRRRIPESPAPSVTASRVLRTGESYIGVKYVWGGNSPSQGFDCSGFTKFIFAKYGITLPRTAREQAHSGRPVAADFGSLIPGDIMLFAEPGQAISHVAIYAGNGRILHASSSVGGVGYTDLNSGGEWFVAYFVAARRLL
jgi:peptidoglycan DL-endopeptidase CwlO